MKYSVHSGLMAEMMSSPPRVLRESRFRPLWRPMVWMLVPICYLGGLVAPLVVLGAPLDSVRGIHLPAAVFWATALWIGLWAAWTLYRMVVRSMLAFRQRVFHLEALVFCLGLVLGLSAMVCEVLQFQAGH
jgi:hypothetical protein